MTLKTAVDSAAIRTVGNVPTSVFGSSAQISLEMADLATEVAIEIAESAEWRSLVKIAEMVGADSFPKPADYDRMMSGQGILNKDSWFWGYINFQSVEEYLMAINGRLPMMQPGGWILLGDEFKFYPAPTGIAQFPYISSHIVRANDGTTKAGFTADDDTFILSERLLTLGLIWRWKAQKGLEYSEDMALYQQALGQEQNKDKGERMLRPDRRWRFPALSSVYLGRGI